MKIRSLLPALCGALSLAAAASADTCTPTFDLPTGTPGSSSSIFLLQPSDYFSPGTQQMIVGGGFASIGGVSGTSGVAVWNGTTYSPIGLGIDFGGQTPEVLSAINFGGKLYIGGQFFGAIEGASSRGIIRWNGSAFEPVNPDITFSVVVRTMVTYKNELYVAGNFARIGTLVTNSIAKLNATGDDFLAVGGGVLSSANVTDMVVFNDGSGEKLYVTGQFTVVYNDVTTPISNTRWIARWDGTTWESVGGGIVSGGGTNYPKDLIVFDDGTGPALYTFGGRSFASGVGTQSSVHKWNGTQWTSVEGFLDSPLDTASTVWSAGIANYGSGTTIFAEARFSETGGANVRNALVRLENGRFNLVPGVAFNNNVHEITSINDGTGFKTWFGGSHTTVNGQPANYLAIMTGCTSSSAPACPADFNQSDSVTIDDLFLFLNAWFAGCP